MERNCDRMVNKSLTEEAGQSLQRGNCGPKGSKSGYVRMMIEEDRARFGGEGAVLVARDEVEFSRP
jgi:hypothetical protein